MGIIYRYVDLDDEIIKYVGTVWSGDCTLKDKHLWHKEHDSWCKDNHWRIEYLQKDIKTRVESDIFESHYVSKFGTNEYFNTHTVGYGMSDTVDDTNDVWEIFYSDDEARPSEFVKRLEITGCKFLEMNDGGICLRLDTDEYTICLPWVSGNSLGCYESYPVIASDGSQTAWKMLADSFRIILSDNLTFCADIEYFSLHEIPELIMRYCTLVCEVSELTGDLAACIVDTEEHFNTVLCWRLSHMKARPGVADYYQPTAVQVWINDSAEIETLPHMFVKQTNTEDFVAFCKKGHNIISYLPSTFMAK